MRDEFGPTGKGIYRGNRELEGAVSPDDLIIDSQVISKGFVVIMSDY